MQQDNTPIENPIETEALTETSAHEGESQFKTGDDVTLVRVRFPGNSKSFPFLLGERKFRYGQKVFAMSDRGMDVGYINSFPYTVKFKRDLLPLKSIDRDATSEDIQEQKNNIDTQREASVLCKRLAGELNLEMTITHVELIQFGKKMVFYFNSPGRVDFRELVKKLVAELKMRIELRQIGVRDRVAALGSIGACGLSTCCSSFLKNYGNVSLKLAKNQNLALIPSKINGVCGQVKCCVKYEDDVYNEKRKILPREGSFIKAKNGDLGKVTKLHLLKEQFDMLTDQGLIRRYARNQFNPKVKTPHDWKYPKSFEYVKNETSKVIGLEEDIQTEETPISFRAEPKVTAEAPKKEEKKTSPQREESSSPEKKNNRSRSRNRNRKRRNRPKE